MAVEVVEIDLLGSSFTVQTDESREYMAALVAELERRLHALRQTTQVADPLKLSILGSITILDELVRLRERSGEGDELGRRAELLIGKLDAGLGNERPSSSLPSSAGPESPAEGALR